MIVALSFTNAPALWLLLAAPVFWLFLRNADRAREQRISALIGPRSPRLAGKVEARFENARATFASVTLAALALALAEPRHGPAATGAASPSLDILVCLDVSRSMRARDLEPDRLGFAHAALERFAQSARGDRLGLVAFAGEARLICPLTHDVDSFVQLMRNTDEISVDRGGTNLAAALSTSLRALDPGADSDSPTRPAAILLVTDGEDLAGQGAAVADTCLRRGIPVHCLGLGSALGSKIPLATRGGDEEFLKDKNGREVLSRLDAVGLEALAARSGGGTFRASTVANPDTLIELYERALRPLARATGTAESGELESPRWQIALWIAWIAALLFMTVGRKRSPQAA